VSRWLCGLLGLISGTLLLSYGLSIVSGMAASAGWSFRAVPAVGVLITIAAVALLGYSVWLIFAPGRRNRFL
jgi:hypothetical protein